MAAEAAEGEAVAGATPGPVDHERDDDAVGRGTRLVGLEVRILDAGPSHDGTRPRRQRHAALQASLFPVGGGGPSLDRLAAAVMSRSGVKQAARQMGNSRPLN